MKLIERQLVYLVNQIVFIISNSKINNIHLYIFITLFNILIMYLILKSNFIFIFFINDFMIFIKKKNLN